MINVPGIELKYNQKVYVVTLKQKDSVLEFSVGYFRGVLQRYSSEFNLNTSILLSITPNVASDVIDGHWSEYADDCYLSELEALTVMTTRAHVVTAGSIAESAYK